MTDYGDRVAAALASVEERIGEPVDRHDPRLRPRRPRQPGGWRIGGDPQRRDRGNARRHRPGPCGPAGGGPALRPPGGDDGRAAPPYEGWSARDVALPVYLLRGLGAFRLVVTNSAGGLSPEFAPGEVMLIEDHLNLTGLNPLVGLNDDRLGLRFPDMSRAYDPDLRARALKIAAANKIRLRRGIYAGILGPSLEGPRPSGAGCGAAGRMRWACPRCWR